DRSQQHLGERVGGEHGLPLHASFPAAGQQCAGAPCKLFQCRASRENPGDQRLLISQPDVALFLAHGNFEQGGVTAEDAAPDLLQSQGLWIGCNSSRTGLRLVVFEKQRSQSTVHGCELLRRGPDGNKVATYPLGFGKLGTDCPLSFEKSRRGGRAGARSLDTVEEAASPGMLADLQGLGSEAAARLPRIELHEKLDRHLKEVIANGQKRGPQGRAARLATKRLDEAQGFPDRSEGALEIA